MDVLCATGLKVKTPTVTRLTSGSGTYNWPTGCVYIRVRRKAGGGGGAGGGTTPGAATDGGDTTFAGLPTVGGGKKAVTTTPGAGGTVTSAMIGMNGQPGANCYTGNAAFNWGSQGGGALSDKAVTNSRARDAAPANSGAGGGGGATGSTSLAVGAGGGEGAEAIDYLANTGSGIAYAVGAKGNGGTAGTNGFAGGDGGSGVIEIEEFYG